MQFTQEGLNIDSLVNIITYQKDFEAYLLDIQNDYRFQRAMGEDEGDRLLTGTRVIDDIISRMSHLEKAREEYFKALKEAEAKKREEEAKK